MPKKADDRSMRNSEDINKTLVDNFINLQKVLTNLSIKFDELSTNISKLLELFEISAKSFAEKYNEGEIKASNIVDREFVNKLNTLIDQNKVISKGIILIEERIREKEKPYMRQPMSGMNNLQNNNTQIKPRQLPRY